MYPRQPDFLSACVSYPVSILHPKAKAVCKTLKSFCSIIVASLSSFQLWQCCYFTNYIQGKRVQNIYHKYLVLAMYLIWKSNYLTFIDNYYLRNQSRENKSGPNLQSISLLMKNIVHSFPSELHSSLTPICSVLFEPVKMWKLKF